MEEPVVGRRLRSASDQCPGTVQWTDPGRARMGVRWDDGTTSAEHMGGVGDTGWEWAEGTGHVCSDACACPVHGSDTWYHPASGEHACQRSDCRYAGGLEKQLAVEYERAWEARIARRGGPPPGWPPTPPPTWEPGS